MAGKAEYTDPGVVSAMKLWGRLIEQGYFTDPSAVTLGTGASNFTNYFKQGKMGMVQIGTWFEPTLVAGGMKPGTDFGSFIMPNINPRAPKVVIYETGPMVVAEHGSNKADALKALDYFMSRQGQATWVKATGFVSPRTDVPSTSPVDRQLGAEIPKGGYTQFNRYWEATPHDIVEVAVDQFDKFMLKGATRTRSCKRSRSRRTRPGAPSNSSVTRAFGMAMEQGAARAAAPCRRSGAAR